MLNLRVRILGQSSKLLLSPNRVSPKSSPSRNNGLPLVRNSARREGLVYSHQ